ncbi:MAG: glycosyltransferase family 4 protein, partial [Chloroflexi bacterium]|nr:glycosyltransferase family 4 protein [Chloroflexota bacterium]
MKVLMVSGEYPPHQGGVGDHTECLCRHLQALGVEVEVAASSLPPGQAAPDSPFPVHRVTARWGWG